MPRRLLAGELHRAVLAFHLQRNQSLMWIRVYHNIRNARKCSCAPHRPRVRTDLQGWKCTNHFLRIKYFWHLKEVRRTLLCIVSGEYCHRFHLEGTPSKKAWNLVNCRDDSIEQPLGLGFGFGFDISTLRFFFSATCYNLRISSGRRVVMRWN